MPLPTTLLNSRNLLFRILFSCSLPLSYLDASTLLSEDAESTSPAVTIISAGGYDAVQTDIVPQGSKAFSLGHVSFSDSDQTINLINSVSPSSGTKLYFESKLGWASSTQVAHVDVSSDGGSNWSSIWNKAGTDGAGDGMFSLQTVDLSSFEGMTLLLRFRFSFATGTYYSKTSSGIGWYFDNIQVGDIFSTREWSIGSPTAQEQLVIALLNRARSDSQTELQRLINATDSDTVGQYNAWDVDFTVLANQFAGSGYGTHAQAAGEAKSIALNLPPLAPNAKLTSAARLHTQDMFQNQFQGHGSSAGAISPNQPGNGSGQRVTHQGYSYKSIMENVSSYSSNAWNSHAGFIVDWGVSGSTGGQHEGMQDPPGHRFNVFNETAREVGVGVLQGVNGSVGPYLVTHNIGTEQNYDQPFITGIAYYDVDGDGFYSAGEGIGGVSVKVQGGVFHAVTPDSGGFAVPVTSNGTYACTYVMPDGSSETQAVTVSNLQNASFNITPPWSSTTLSGASSFASGSKTTISTPAVAGATSYKLHAYELSTWSTTLGAETAEDINATTFSGYSFRQSEVKSNGSFAYRLLSSGGEDQLIEVNKDILPDSACTLTWQDRLGGMTSKQEAWIEISSDQGVTWLAVEKRNGAGNATGADSFSQKSLNLSAYSGIPIRIRFRIYNPNPTSYYSNTEIGFGWYIDEISLTGADVLATAGTQTSSTNSWNFTSSKQARYLLRGQILNNSNEYALGAGFRIESTESSGGQNSPPVLNNPIVDGILSVNVQEGNTSVVTLLVADSDGDAVSFSLSEEGSSDAEDFQINASTGVLAFLNTPQFDNPEDSDSDNVYNLSVSYTDGIDPPATVPIRVSVQPLTKISLSIQIEGSGSVAGSEAGSHPQGSSLSLAAIPESGYRFSHWAGDASGSNASISLTADADKVVTAVFVKINAVPYLTNALSDGILYFSILEGQSTTFTLTANDDDNNTLTFILSGTDADAFDLNSSTGILRLPSPPDYENPIDANRDNVFDLQVSVSDDQNASDPIALFVAVTDDANDSTNYFSLSIQIARGGSVAASPSSALLQYAEGTKVSLAASPEGGYIFSHWSADINSTSNPFDLVVDANKTIITVFNAIPTITNKQTNGEIHFEVSENNSTSFILSATDDEGSPLAYQLESTGDHKNFDLNRTSGHLSFEAFDFEQPLDEDKNNTYDLSVTVSDGNATSSPINVRITILDLAEDEWSFSIDKGAGWRSFGWFGNYFETTSGEGWIYHETLGWLYRTGDATSSIWFYDDSLKDPDDFLKGWLWTSAQVYPYFYSPGTADWLYYRIDSKNPRIFYSNNNSAWVEK